MNGMEMESQAQFEAIRDDTAREILLLVDSLGGVCAMSAVTAYCRRRGWTGMGPTAVGWLERAGKVTWDREGKMVYRRPDTVGSEEVEDEPQTRGDA